MKTLYDSYYSFFKFFYRLFRFSQNYYSKYFLLGFFVKNVLVLPSLGVFFETAEHIIYHYVDKNNASSSCD